MKVGVYECVFRILKMCGIYLSRRFPRSEPQFALENEFWRTSIYVHGGVVLGFSVLYFVYILSFGIGCACAALG